MGQVLLSKVGTSQRGVFKNQSSSLISPQVAIKKSQPTQPPCESGWFLVAIDTELPVSRLTGRVVKHARLESSASYEVSVRNLAGLGENALERLVIGILAENNRTSIASIQGMVDRILLVNTFRAGHS